MYYETRNNSLSDFLNSLFLTYPECFLDIINGPSYFYIQLNSNFRMPTLRLTSNFASLSHEFVWMSEMEEVSLVS